MPSDISVPEKSKLIFDNVKYQFLASVCGNYHFFVEFFFELIAFAKYIERWVVTLLLSPKISRIGCVGQSSKNNVNFTTILFMDK